MKVSTFFFPEKLINRGANIYSMVWASLIFIPGPDMKNARPTRGGRQWWSHFEFRSGTQNHWKTPTWLQCKLPGQPELPTIAVKVKMPWKNGEKAEGTGGHLHSAPTARRKANNHAGHNFVKDVSWSFLLCHSLPSTCFGSYQTNTSQLHH